MKKVLLAVATMLIAASFGFAQDNLGPHNLMISYGGAPVGANGQGCRSCHAPHGGAIVDSINSLKSTVVSINGGGNFVGFLAGTNKLWDKNLSASQFGLYLSDNVTAGQYATGASSGGQMSQPGSSTDSAWHTYLCLSCHDGSIATFNVPGGLGDPQDYLLNAPSGNGVGDADLTNDHPVNINWPLTGNQAGSGIANAVAYADPTLVSGSTYAGQGATVGPLPLYTNAAAGTTNAIECSTCHNPHRQPTAASGYAGNFLRVTTVTDQTSLCRDCHADKR